MPEADADPAGEAGGRAPDGGPPEGGAPDGVAPGEVDASEEQEEEGVPEELRVGFWRTVVVLNLAGLGVALGAMLWFFERSPWALPVFGGGVAAAVHAYVLYRRYAPDG